MPEPHLPEDLRYDLTHIWVRTDGDTATLGVTDAGQRAFGEAGFVQLPRVGTDLRAGDALGQISSGASGPVDLLAPLDGAVVQVNDALAAEPHLVNVDPYQEGWLVRVELSDPAQLRNLLDAGAYRQTLSQPRAGNVDAVLGSVFQHARDAMVLVDRFRRILAMNPAAEALTGFQAGEADDWSRCYHMFRCEHGGIPVHGVDCPGVSTRQDACPGCKAQYSITRKDGRQVPVSATYSPIPSPDSNELYLLITLREREP